MLELAVAQPRTDAVAPREAPPSKRLARVAGVLLIVATVTSVIGGGLVDSVVGAADHLAKISANQDRAIAGVTLQLIAAFSSAGIGIALYPAVRRHDAALALGSAGFRIIEGTLYVVGAVGTLLLLKLGQEYARAVGPSSAYFQTTGALLRTLRDDAALTGILAFYLGGGMYYYVFYRARVLPRWLAGWGLVGVAIGAIAGLCVLFQITTLKSTLHTALNIPIGLQEMVLAIWLIVKGFSSPSPDAPVIPADEPHRGVPKHA
jgi:Domain of unknown function (DUF4386)